MTITALPVLNRTDATFKADVDTFFGTELPQFSVEAEAARVEINANTVTASAAAASAASQVTLAANQVTLATIQAQAAAGSALVAGAIVWVSGTTYAVGDARYSPINMQTYRRKVAGAGTTDPSLDLTNWSLAADAGAKLLRSARTSNAVLGTADNGRLIDITSGTFTQTFAAVATLGSDWFCYIRNSNTTPIDINGSFDTANKWTLGVGVTISGGKAVLSSAGNSLLTANPSPLVAGVEYDFQFEFVNTSGGGSSVLVNAGGVNISLTNIATGTTSTQVTATGTYKSTFTASAAAPFIFQNTSGFGLSGSIDNAVLKTSSGDITLDPNASETIDGLTSYIMYPGECRLVQCDGSALRTVVLNSFYKAFTSSVSFTKPPGYQVLSGLLWSAGSSGNKTAGSPVGGGGGGCFPFNLPASVVAATETVTIGSGGAASTTASLNSGGNSSFGSLVTVYGASNQIGGAVKNPRTAAALTTSRTDPFGFEATDNTAGQRSAVYGGGTAHTDSADGGASVYGAGAGGGYNLSARAGGASVFGGAGGACGDAVNGVDGTAPGGGGGGTRTGAQSGAGARGELRIWGII